MGMSHVMKNVYVPKGATVKNIVNATNYYVNFHIMDVTVLKAIVALIIVLAI